MIDREDFLNWAEPRLGDYRGEGDEIKFNSPFDPDGDDRKRKLWCNIAGGKDRREDGVYHCWISGEKGTLIGLVMRLEGCDRDRAVEILGGDRSLAALESKMEAIFGGPQEEPTAPAPPGGLALALPEGVVPLDSLGRYDRRRVAAEAYLRGRRLPTEGFFLGTSGMYRDRVVIPYYDRQGALIYFNGRHLWKDSPKYLGPPKDSGVGKGDVLYVPSWPDPGQVLFITEGEFDALSLHLAGLHAAAVGGSNLTWNQVKILRKYRIVAAVDNDEAGEVALQRILGELRDYGMVGQSYIRPPKGVKDWNDLLVKLGPDVVRMYATNRAKVYSGVLP